MIEPVRKMLLRVILILFSICCCCCSSAFAEKNFWNNDVCTTDSDCSGLTSCDLTFGCTISGAKVGFIMVTVFLALCVILITIAYLCRRRTSQIIRPHNQYVPHTVITTSTPQWYQHQMGANTTVYPHNPYPNQFYPNSVNPPMHSEYQVPTAAPAYNYGYATHTYH